MIRSDRRRRAGRRPAWTAAAAFLLVAGTAAAGAGILLVACATGAGAEEAVPLHLKVRPSGLDPSSDEARARQEQLEARMRRNEFLFRSICRTCSREDRFASEAPFHPLQTLRSVPDPGSGEGNPEQ